MTGIGAIAAPGKISMKASGLVQNGVILPTSFSSSQLAAGVKQTLRLSLAAGNIKSAEADPPFADSKERVPLKDEHKRNIVDPASAFIMMVVHKSLRIGPGACDRTLRVFDGLFRTDLELAYLRVEKLNTEGYTGPASVCSVRYVPIAGHKPNAAMTEFLTRNKGIEVRLAPASNTSQVILISATMPTPAGLGRIELEGYQVEATSVSPNR